MLLTGLVGGFQGCSPQERMLVFSSAQAEERAAELWSQIESHPEDPNCHIELGKIFLSEGYFDAAVTEFEEALAVDSKHLQAHLLLALALQKQPRPDLTRATDVLKEAVRIAPQNAQAHLNLAQVYDKLGKADKAVSEFQRTVELSDDPAVLVSAHLGLMALYKKQGDIDKADEQYDAARRIYPGVEDMIVQAEINRSTPPPVYPGDPRQEGKGLHPSLETRMKRAKEAISEMNGERQ
jgi:Tfp pilus assembly protein PilF